MKKSFDEEIKNRLKDIEMPYDASAWKTMSDNLDKKRGKPSSNKYKWLIPVISLITISSLSIYLYTNNNLSTNENKIKHISLEVAKHGYDNPFLFFGFTFDKLPSLHIINDECTLTISNIGEMKTISNNKVSGPKESAELLDKCSTKGVSVKYSPYATEKTYVEIIEFLKRI